MTNGKETGFESPLFSPDGLACKKMEQKALCVMDTGDGAGLVYRTGHSQMFIPTPIAGHWLKNSSGIYYKLSKMKYIPRIPRM